MSEAQDDRIVLRVAAMDLLARREHSGHELQRKLSKRFPALADGAVLHAVIKELAHDGLQSDERCAESVVRSRRARGQGPLRIRQDLWQRGIADEIAGQALAEQDDWVALARTALEQKFGAAPVTDRKQWARRARFLTSRGFPESMVRVALRNSGPELD